MSLKETNTELVSNSPNLLQNLERAEEPEGKFVA